MNTKNDTPPGQTEARPVDPDELMAHVSELSIVKTSLVSFGFHVLLIGLTSIGFLALCFKHNSCHPMRIEREIAKRQQEDQAQRQREQRQAKLLERQTGTKTPGKGPTTTTGRAQTPIEKAITETSDERPTTSTLNLDNLDE